MSYLNQAQDPRRRATALAGTAAIHAVLGLAIVTGLTIGGYKPFDEYKPIIKFPIDEPEPQPPEPQQQSEPQDSFITVPPTPFDPIVADPIDIVVQDPIVDQRPFVVDPGPIVGPTPEPLQAALFTPRGARPSNRPQSWISNADYPASTEAEGIAAYRLIVGTNGRVSACEVTRSTGNRQLDGATCKLIERRARFEAATDETGAKVVGSYSGTVKWEIPE